jgi:ribosomal protein S18 acetylase RimI-like enzyme
MLTTQIRLDPMTETEYQEFRTTSVAGYAQAKVEAGAWTQEESLAKSDAIFDELLPDGIASPDNYLFMVRDVNGEQSVAVLWFALQGEPARREVYIYQIEVAEKFRGRGYGRATMQACADKARMLGATSVRLHVFGRNKVARSLYTSLGFTETDVMMSLPLK